MTAEARPAKADHSVWRQLGGTLNASRNYGVVVMFVLLFAILSVASGPFLTKTNLLNIAFEWSATGIIAAAGTLVLITGGFDLSVAAVFSLAGVVAARFVGPIGVGPALLAGIAAGALVGLINGALIVVCRVNSIIVTLASGFIIDGVATQITGGNLITVADPAFAKLGNGTFLGVQTPTWCFVGVALLLGILLHRMTFGRYIYAIGDNIDAAKLAGIRTGGIAIGVYVLSGLAAGFAGVLIASQQSTGQAASDPNLVFQVIAAIIVGGTSILGGSGAIWRTVVGIGLLGLIGNGATLLNLSETYQEIISGLIILAAASLDVMGRRRAGTA